MKTWKIIDFNSRFSKTDLETELNSLAADGWEVQSLSISKRQFVYDGTNHGHGGYYETEATIVVYR